MQRLLCELGNLERKIVAELQRPERPEIYWNGVQIVSKSNLPQTTGKLQIAVKVQLQNSLRVNLKGLPTSYLSVEIKSESQTPNQIPVARISATPTGGIAPELISFSGITSSDPDGDVITNYEWDFGDGGFATGMVVTHNFAMPATYNVKLTVTDSKGGKGTATLPVVIKANQLPLANFVTTTDTALGVLKAHFDASTSSDSDGSIVDYQWSFGDGSTGSGKVVDHVYQTSGIYSVSLVVKDNKQGLGQKSASVVMKDQTGPVLSITSPKDGSVIASKAFQLTGTSAEALSALSIQLNGSAAVDVEMNSDRKTFSQNYQVLSPGLQVLKIRAVDLAGNESTQEIRFTSDYNQAPIASLTLKSKATGDAPFVVWVDAAGSVDPDGQVIQYLWDFGDGESIQNGESTATHVYQNAGSYLITLTVKDPVGAQAQKTVAIEVKTVAVPEAPVAPPLATEELTEFKDQYAFLYTGSNALQKDVNPDVFDPKGVSLVYGQVLDEEGKPLGGVEVTSAGESKYGRTWTRDDGRFDFAINLNTSVYLSFNRPGYISAQRQIEMDGQNAYGVGTLRLVKFDDKVTKIEMNSPVAQVAKANQVYDQSGPRTASVIIPAGVTAKIRLPNGTFVEAGQLSIRATEFTVGEHGPERMPAALPKRSAYTYAVELSADEARAMGAEHVEFSKPVSFYVDNFLNVPVGAAVPLGYYNPKRKAWDTLKNGIVMRILSIDNGKAVVDLGSGSAASAEDLAYHGFDESELRKLATDYETGKTLWRAQVAHFSAIDLNFSWASTAPIKTIPPPGSTIEPGACASKTPMTKPGSIIDTSRQILKEEIPLPGVNQSLFYSTERTAGRMASSSLMIPLVDNAVPDLVNVEVTVDVAGKREVRNFEPTPKTYYDFVWDGLDQFGRRMTGMQKAIVQISYQYDSRYWVTWFDKNRAGTFDTLNEGISVTIIPSRQMINVNKTFVVPLRPADDLTTAAATKEINGWTFNQHHFYDKSTKRIFYGNGDSRSISNIPEQIKTIVGTGTAGNSGDGGPASQASIGRVQNIYYDSVERAIYICDIDNHRIRKVDEGGIITTIAGTGTQGSGGDGGPATSASLNQPYDLTISADRSIYFSEYGGNRIRKIDTNGIISTVAGTGGFGYSGDGGPALSATFKNPRSVMFGSDGSLYISDDGSNVIRRVTPDGIIRTIAGTGVRGSTGDGGLAIDANFENPNFTAMDKDGNIYIAEGGTSARVRRISPGGIVETVAGTGEVGFSGDDGLATNAKIGSVAKVVALDSGELYIVDRNNFRVRYVDSQGVIRTVMGDGRSLVGSDGVPGPLTSFVNPQDVDVMPDGTLLVTDTGAFKIRQYSSVFFSNDGNGNTVVPSEDGSEIFIFDSKGQHLKTLFAMTGGVKWVFAYSNGQLASIQDGNGNKTVIERNGSGKAVSITSPYGNVFPLQMDESGNLTKVTMPTGESYQMVYQEKGLITKFTNPKGSFSQYSYDIFGRLVKAIDASGFVQTIRMDPNGWMGYYNDDTEWHGAFVAGNAHGGAIIEGNNGGALETKVSYQNTETGTHSDGVGNVKTLQSWTSDSRLTGLTKVPITSMVANSSGRTKRSNYSRSYTKLNGLFDFQFTDTTTTNRNGLIQSTYDSGSKTWSTVTATGKTSVTQNDLLNRPIYSKIGNDTPIQYEYNSRGTLARMAQGNRVTEYTYDSNGYLSSVRDPMNRVSSYTNDAAGRKLASVDAGGLRTEFGYDGSSNLTSIKNAMGILHEMFYTAIDMLTIYRSPEIGESSRDLEFSYINGSLASRKIRKKKFADGRSIDYQYDASGKARLIGMIGSDASWSGTYVTVRDVFASQSSGANTISYSYDGFLPVQKSYAWQGGPSYTYLEGHTTNGLLVANHTLNGAAVTIGYDRDEQPTQIGAMTIVRDSVSGRISKATLGNLVTTRSYNGFGEISKEETLVSNSVVHSQAYIRDNLGRLQQRTTVDASGANVTDYEYDLSGRLTKVVLNGSMSEQYAYDGQGNRLMASYPGKVIAATYDHQDRIRTYGDWTFEYSADGAMSAKRNVNGDYALYTYDVFGHLVKVVLSNGKTIQYLRDGEGRRGARVGSSGETIYYAYDYTGRLIAEMKPSGEAKAHFIYEGSSHSPEYMIRDGVAYRFVKNQIGSVLFVVNTASIGVVQSIKYDEFGRVLSDSNPGFQPFGFAGGIYDFDTGLVRFGARDYDPEIGRWISKDPILFKGGDANLYGYTINDPINLIDPSGLSFDASKFGKCVSSMTAIIKGVGLTEAILIAGCATTFYGNALGINSCIATVSRTALINMAPIVAACAAEAYTKDSENKCDSSIQCCM